jgi:hypothetical protein
MYIHTQLSKPRDFVFKHIAAAGRNSIRLHNEILVSTYSRYETFSSLARRLQVKIVCRPLRVYYIVIVETKLLHA